MRRVILESPFAGKNAEEIKANIAYARAAVRDCVLRGDSAYASHLVFTQPGILKDADQNERALGMKAGMAWTAVAEAVVVYTDRGISSGMKAGITRAGKHGLPIEYRSLPPATTTETTPAELHDLLLAIGHDVEPEALALAAKSEIDVRNAIAWAKREHAIAQGLAVDLNASCPTWLGDLLDASPETEP